MDILLFPIDSYERHGLPEEFEGKTINKSELGEGVLIYNLSDFMEVFNDGEFGDIQNFQDNYWMSYAIVNPVR